MEQYHPMQGQPAYTIDPRITSRMAGPNLTMDEWTSHFNDRGKVLMSAPDAYHAGKCGSKEVLDSIIGSPVKGGLSTNTRISYSGDDLSGRITHHHGSTVVMPTQRFVPIIPVCDKMSLADVLRIDDGIAYFQSLFDTDDEPRDIASILMLIANNMPDSIPHKYRPHRQIRDLDSIRVFTPDQSSRNSHSERDVYFNPFVLGFSIENKSLKWQAEGLKNRDRIYSGFDVAPMTPQNGN